MVASFYHLVSLVECDIAAWCHRSCTEQCDDRFSTLVADNLQSDFFLFVSISDVDVDCFQHVVNRRIALFALVSTSIVVVFVRKALTIVFICVVAAEWLKGARFI